jgi:hypothetical protein
MLKCKTNPVSFWMVITFVITLFKIQNMATTRKKYKTTPAARAVVEEPAVSYTSSLRAIGNSKGVILNSHVIEMAGLNPDIDIVIRAAQGVITIVQSRETGINTDLSTWDKQFKAAVKNGAEPEGDLFEGLENDFDKKEWQ